MFNFFQVPRMTDCGLWIHHINSLHTIQRSLLGHNPLLNLQEDIHLLLPPQNLLEDIHLLHLRENLPEDHKLLLQKNLQEGTQKNLQEGTQKNLPEDTQKNLPGDTQKNLPEDTHQHLFQANLPGDILIAQQCLLTFHRVFHQVLQNPGNHIQNLENLTPVIPVMMPFL